MLKTRVRNVISYHDKWYANGEIYESSQVLNLIFWDCNCEITLNGEKVKFKTCDDS